MNNTRDDERIRKQELQDYEDTKTILTDIFSDYTTTFTQMPEFSHSDMRMEVVGHQPHLYNVEIKTRNQDMTKYQTLPLKEAKLQRLVADTKEDEKLIYVVLVNGTEYFIFDLDNIDFNTVEKRNWRIKKQEYNIGGSKYINVPTYFIPIHLAVNNGLINK